MSRHYVQYVSPRLGFLVYSFSISSFLPASSLVSGSPSLYSRYILQGTFQSSTSALEHVHTISFIRSVDHIRVKFVLIENLTPDEEK